MESNENIGLQPPQETTPVTTTLKTSRLAKYSFAFGLIGILGPVTLILLIVLMLWTIKPDIGIYMILSVIYSLVLLLMPFLTELLRKGF